MTRDDELRSLLGALSVVIAREADEGERRRLLDAALEMIRQRREGTR